MILSALSALGATAATGAAAAATTGAATAGAASVGTAAASLSGMVGTAATLAGTAMGFIGQQKQAKAMEKAEQARERQMKLDAARQRRQIIRESIMARSQALSAATQQGAEGGSGLAGGTAQITGDAARGVLYTNQSEKIGSSIFAANREASKASSFAAMGSGISSLGGMIANAAPQIGRLSEYHMNRRRNPYAFGARY